MKILIDDAVPFIRGVFEPYADVVYLPGAKISRSDLMTAHGMIVRTRTQCNKALLEGTSVKMIATATIGTDHIDLGYCSSAGIFVQNAAGCNAGGVADYVFSALYGCAARKSIELSGKTIGIVGVGHVGRRVESMAHALGLKVLRCDPPRAAAEGPAQFCDLDFLLAQSDIVTVHVPLLDNTRRMCNAAFFEKMKYGSIFINTSRGQVVEDKALKDAREKLSAIIIDVWSNEPDIDRELLSLADIATPHIAGYSLQGKINGTLMSVRALARYFGIKELFDFFPSEKIEGSDAVHVSITGMNQGQIASIFQYNYPVFTDDFMFRMNPEDFDWLRKNYNYRREFIID